MIVITSRKELSDRFPIEVIVNTLDVDQNMNFAEVHDEYEFELTEAQWASLILQCATLSGQASQRAAFDTAWLQLLEVKPGDTLGTEYVAVADPAGGSAYWKHRSEIEAERQKN